MPLCAQLYGVALGTTSFPSWCSSMVLHGPPMVITILFNGQSMASVHQVQLLASMVQTLHRICPMGGILDLWSNAKKRAFLSLRLLSFLLNYFEEIKVTIYHKDVVGHILLSCLESLLRLLLNQTTFSIYICFLCPHPPCQTMIRHLVPSTNTLNFHTNVFEDCMQYDRMQVLQQTIYATWQYLIAPRL